MLRSLSFEKVREYGPRLLRIVGWGLVMLLISAALISFRILLCDETDIVWDHPTMFPEVVRMAYSPDSRSEWGPVWDMLFLVLPMLIYGAAFVPKLWEGDDDEYAPYRRVNWEGLRLPVVAAEPPALEWGYEDYEVVRPEEQVFRSRTPTLRGFPAVRPPAEPAKPATSQADVDKGWEDLAK